MALLVDELVAATLSHYPDSTDIDLEFVT